MSNEHTKGEWYAVRCYRDAISRDGDHTTISDDFMTVFMGDDEENHIDVHGPNQKANARLVEAAPELLAILDELESSFDEQVYEERKHEDFDAPDDREYGVNITAKQLRAISAAITKASAKAA